MTRKALLVLGAIALVLAVTSGGVAASTWIITKSSQVKPGAIAYKNLAPGAKAKLRGPRGATGVPGGPGGPGTSALAQFGGLVNHGQTLCLGAWASSGQGPCLGAAYAADTHSLVYGPMPAGLTVQHLSAVAATAPNVGPMTITVLDNGGSTVLTCIIPKTATTCTDSAHSFSTAAGDFLEVRVTNDPANTVNSRFVVSFTY
jgi:hypothetical protein